MHAVTETARWKDQNVLNCFAWSLFISRRSQKMNDWGLCLTAFIVEVKLNVILFLFFLFNHVLFQDDTQDEGQSKTKQESAWLFRLWYTFDHKYPFFVCVYKSFVI